MNLIEMQGLLPHILLGQQTLDSHPPQGKVEPGEKLLGVLEDQVARSLCCLSKRLEEFEEDYRSANGIDDRKAFDALPEALQTEHRLQLQKVRATAIAVRSLFFDRLGTSFPESTSEKVEHAVREGWQVVVWKRERSAPEIMGMIVEVVRADDGDGGEKGEGEDKPAPGKS